MLVARRLNSVPSAAIAHFQFTQPPAAGFDALLCQRTQGCMKIANHTGFCSGHKGFKRKMPEGGSASGGSGGAGVWMSPGGGGSAAAAAPTPPRKRAAVKRRSSIDIKDDGAPEQRLLNSYAGVHVCCLLGTPACSFWQCEESVWHC